MNKTNKVAFTVLGVVAAILFVLLIAGLIAKKKIRENIEESLGSRADWEELEVKVFKGRIAFTNPTFHQGTSTVKAQSVVLRDLAYFEYLFNDRMEIGALEIDQPEILISRNSPDSTQREDSNSKFEKEILIRSVTVANGSLTKPGEKEEYPLLYFLINNAELREVRIDAASLQQKVPFKYSGYNIQLDSVRSELDGRHDLLVNSFIGKNGDLRMEEIRILPRYDKVEFQKQISFERDRIDLTADSASITSFEWGFERDTLRLEAERFLIAGADLEVYRNKLMPEDMRRKPLYSEALRKLPVKLRFSKAEIRDSEILYEEKSVENRPPGRVSFHNISGEIENITNIGLDREDFPLTTAHAEALLHDNSPVVLDLEFDVSNLNEKFTASGTLRQVSAGAINAFVRPILGVEAQGGIDYFAFTFTGNDDFATGDVRTRYEDFKIHILKDDGTEKSSFWSAIANLFINNDAVTEDVAHRDLKVERNKNRSFWNFLWLCIRKGALSSFL